MISEANCKSRDHEHIDFRMSEDPEEVHPHHGRTSGLRIEEMPTQVTVHQQHQLRSRERADQPEAPGAHREIEPGKQRHLTEHHSLATHAEDGGNNVDRGSDAAETGNQQRQGPEIRAVARRKSL